MNVLRPLLLAAVICGLAGCLWPRSARTTRMAEQARADRQAKSEPVPEAPARDRLPLLARALASRSPAVRARAFQEIAALPEIDEHLLRGLVDAVLAPAQPDPASPFGVKALARHGVAAIPQLVKRLSEADPSSEAFQRVLACLGAMKRNAAPAVPVLLPVLDNPAAAPGVHAMVRVALANMGLPSPDRLKAILADLAEPGPAGTAAAQAIALYGDGGWVTQEMVQALALRLKHQEPHAAAFAALALGSLGEKALPAAGRLEAALESSIGAPDRASDCIIFGLALARVSSGRRPEALRRVARELGPQGFRPPADWPAMYWASWTIAAEQVVWGLVAILQSEDWSLAPGAASMLGAIGYSARGATPVLSHVVRTALRQAARSDKAQAQRCRIAAAVAAAALGAVADPAELPAVRNLARQVSSEEKEVLDALARSAALISLEP